MEKEKIGFYSSRGKHGCFSNFSRHPITVDGKVYPTTEHYYQSKKFEGTKYEEQVRLSKGPKASAKLGRTRSLPLRKDWEQVKEDMMRVAIAAKFDQHPKCKETLIGTGKAHLFEDSPIDPYWGIGKSGTGKNRLGVLLMELRETLQCWCVGSVSPRMCSCGGSGIKQ